MGNLERSGGDDRGAGITVRSGEIEHAGASLDDTGAVASVTHAPIQFQVVGVWLGDIEGAVGASERYRTTDGSTVRLEISSDVAKQRDQPAPRNGAAPFENQ